MAFISRAYEVRATAQSAKSALPGAVTSVVKTVCLSFDDNSIVALPALICCRHTATFWLYKHLRTADSRWGCHTAFDSWYSRCQCWGAFFYLRDVLTRDQRTLNTSAPPFKLPRVIGGNCAVVSDMRQVLTRRKVQEVVRRPLPENVPPYAR